MITTSYECDGVAEFLLESDVLQVMVSSLGAQVLSIRMKNRDGSFTPVILESDCGRAPEKDSSCLGAVVGRVANRIKDAAFDLNGVHYTLAANNGPNCLHGGLKGFHTKAYSYEVGENRVVLTYVSPDMEEGFPGELTLQVSYVLEGNRFAIYYEAASDADTILNVTNHMYFNLTGTLDTVWEHELCIPAEAYMPVDDTCLVTGAHVPVEGTVFDFRQARPVGPVNLQADEQLTLAKGYDHAFVLDGSGAPICLKDPVSGRQVKIETDMPMVHLYTGNYLASGAKNPEGNVHPDWSGIALETELSPDSIHVEKDPKVILRKGDRFCSCTSYTFS